MKQHRSKRKLRKSVKLVLSLLMIICITVGGTLAYLSVQTGPVVNTFSPSQVSCNVVEEYENSTKKSIQVENKSDIKAFIRVKLVTYRVNNSGQHIGGVAVDPVFECGEGWFKASGYYYYKYPVEPHNSSNDDLTENLLGKEISLSGNYTDADGGKQLIEVMAEAIQAQPSNAVTQVWSIQVDDNGYLIDPVTTGGNS